MGIAPLGRPLVPPPRPRTLATKPHINVILPPPMPGSPSNNDPHSPIPRKTFVPRTKKDPQVCGIILCHWIRFFLFLLLMICLQERESENAEKAARAQARKVALDRKRAERDARKALKSKAKTLPLHSTGEMNAAADDVHLHTMVNQR